MRRVWLAGVAAMAVLLFAAGWFGWGLLRLRPRPGSEEALARLASRLAPAERAALLAGRIDLVDGRTALRWAGEGRYGRPGAVLVVVDTPAVFPRGGDDGERVLAVTRAAVRLKARLMVDCTDADLARLTPAGRRSLLLARQAGLWRLVVFDGAHHAPPLATDPELLLVPILHAGGWPLVVHGYVRDALPLPQLLAVVRALGTAPAIFTLPRLSLPLKEPWPLRLVAARVLRQVAAAEPVSPRPAFSRPLSQPASRSGAGVTYRDGLVAGVRAAPGFLRLPAGQTLVTGSRSGPPDALRLGWGLNVWNLLLRHPAALAWGRPLPRSTSWARWGLSARP